MVLEPNNSRGNSLTTFARFVACQKKTGFPNELTSSALVMPLTEQQFDKLLEQAKSGKQEALLELVLTYQPILGPFVANQVGQNLGSLVNEDDVLQETFVHVLRSIGDFNGNTQVAFLAWLKAIATNRVRDIARKLSAAKRGGAMQQAMEPRNVFESHAFDLLHELSDDGYTPSFFAARREAVSAIQAALVVLPEDQREAIQLHCFDKLTLEETADQMGRSRDSVRGLVQRGKKAMRDLLQSSSRWFSRS